MNILDPVPSFRGYDEDGKLVTSEDLKGSVTVLYFYLQDETPGCTRQACDFRDAFAEIKARGVVVLGVSPDKAESHRSFVTKHKLNFPLLCDPELKIATAFKIVRPKESPGPRIERTTFIIDEKGIIRWIERSVKVEQHVSRIMKALDSIKTS